MPYCVHVKDVIEIYNFERTKVDKNGNNLFNHMEEIERGALRPNYRFFLDEEKLIEIPRGSYIGITAKDEKIIISTVEFNAYYQMIEPYEDGIDTPLPVADDK
jgi:hypothetical protein